MADLAMREAMNKLALGDSHGGHVAFQQTMDRNNADFEALLPERELKP